MTETDWMADRFEANRTRLRSVAFRMLGSTTEADDAVQEAWLRFSRAGDTGVENLGGWLTTVVARVCLDVLRARKARREEPLDTHAQDGGNPEEEVMLADSVGLAMLVVLETLTPAERVAFVLHDMFEVPFEDIAPIVRRSPAAARQLASRARRRVRGADAAPSGQANHRAIVEAFLAASRRGDFSALIGLLDPDAVLRTDSRVTAMGAPAEVRGAEAVAQTFAGRARTARMADLDGEPGLVWSVGGRPRVIFRFTFAGDRIAGIAMEGA